MKLNKIEFMLMNNPIRAFVQDIHEVRILRKMSAIESIDKALEIGCGNGNGTRLIKKYFKPININAIDIDEKMIKIAQQKNKDKSIKFEVMSATELIFANNYFDAIFDFGIIHHIPDWKKCINELRRVLKPGGELVLEELSIDSFSKGIGIIWRKILDHPYDNMYSNKEFVQYLKEQNFEIKCYAEYNAMMLFKHMSIVAIKN